MSESDGDTQHDVQQDMGEPQRDSGIEGWDVPRGKQHVRDQYDCDQHHDVLQRNE